MSPWRLARISHALLRGAVIAYPTDTIWGLGCHPLDAAAVSRINRIKQRPAGKSLILLTSNIDYLSGYIDFSSIDAIARKPVSAQPTTWVVPVAASCPAWLAAGDRTVAVRITLHAPITELCEPIRSPLISTSANRSGKPSIRNSLQAHRQFGNDVDFIVEGYQSGSQRASRIIDLQSGRSLRG